MSENELNPETWVDEHGDAMIRYAYSRLGDRARAEDVVQEAFLGAYKSKDRYQGTYPVKAWLMGILKHKIVDYIRKASRETLMEDPEIVNSFNTRLYKYSGIPDRNPPPWQFDPSKAAEYADFWPIFQGCLSKLKEPHHSAFVLRELENKTNDEICNVLGISSNYLCVLIHRARAQLKECLEKNWMEPDMTA